MVEGVLEEDWKRRMAMLAKEDVVVDLCPPGSFVPGISSIVNAEVSALRSGVAPSGSALYPVESSRRSASSATGGAAPSAAVVLDIGEKAAAASQEHAARRSEKRDYQVDTKRRFPDEWADCAMLLMRCLWYVLVPYFRAQEVTAARAWNVERFLKGAQMGPRVMEGVRQAAGLCDAGAQLPTEHRELRRVFSDVNVRPALAHELAILAGEVQVLVSKRSIRLKPFYVPNARIREEILDATIREFRQSMVIVFREQVRARPRWSEISLESQDSLWDRRSGGRADRAASSWQGSSSSWERQPRSWGRDARERGGR